MLNEQNEAVPNRETNETSSVEGSSEASQFGIDENTLGLLKEDAVREGRPLEDVVADYKQIEAEWDRVEREGPEVEIPPEAEERMHRFIREIVKRFILQERD